jgi:uncharacterized damage-inducible protein DinB
MNPLIAHFQMMARYNRLANERLYECCARLSDAERKKNRQAFFKSIHGTLNHIMVGDRNWMTRFEGGVASSSLRAASRRPPGSTPSCTTVSTSCAQRGFARTSASSVSWRR